MPGFSLKGAEEPKKAEEVTLYCVKVSRKWGYIDKNGKIVIQPKFGVAFDFTEGLARLKVNGKYGYIDRRGKPSSSPTLMKTE